MAPWVIGAAACVSSDRAEVEAASIRGRALAIPSILTATAPVIGGYVSVRLKGPPNTQFTIARGNPSGTTTVGPFTFSVGNAHELVHSITTDGDGWAQLTTVATPGGLQANDIVSMQAAWLEVVP